MILSICPTCHALVVFPEHLCGTGSHCPGCAARIDVPSREPTDDEREELLRYYRQAGNVEPDHRR
jgi:hypothetical protein